MTAPAVALQPFDPAPPPARSSALVASGGQFLNLLAPVRVPSKTGSVNLLPPSSPAGTGTTATLRVVANGNGAQRPSGDHNRGSDQSSASSSPSATAVVVVPVPPPTPAPAAVAPALTGAATAALQSLPAGLPGAAALLQVPTTLNRAADAAPIGGSAGAAAADAAAAALLNAATATATATGAAGPGPATDGAAPPTLLVQTLPPMAANLSLRLANNAAQLVSQPSVTLASAALETAAQAKPAGAETELAALNRQSTLSDAAHGLSKPAVAAPAPGSDEFFKAAAKDVADAATQIVHDAAGQNPAAPAQPAASAPAAPQVVALTPPPPVNLASINEMPAALPIPPHVVAEQVAVSLRQAVNTGNDHIQIQLQPADLGAVEVKLSINHDGRVTMVVSADRSDTLNLLQQDAGGLTQALRDAGLQADSSSLSFNLRGGYQFNQQQAAGAGTSAFDDTSTGGIDGIDVPPASRLRAHSGSLDIHV